MKRLVLLSLSVLAASSALAQISYSENFDSYSANTTLGGQGGWVNGTYTTSMLPVSLTDLFSASPDNSSYHDLWNNTEATGAYSWQYIGHSMSDPDGSMDLSYNFYVEEDGTRNGIALANINLNKVVDGSGWGTFQFQSSSDPLYDNAMLYQDQAGNFNYLGSFETPRNTWHNIRARINSTNGNATIWVNDQMIGRTFFNAPARVGWMNQLSYTFGANANQAVAFDDIEFNSKPTTTITGTVNFQGLTDVVYAPYIFWVQASFWSGGSKVDEAAGYVDIDGNLTLDCSLPDGAYEMFVDGWYCQRRQATVTVIGGSASVNITLPSGDCDSTGVVDIADYTIIASSFDEILDTDPEAEGFQPSANWDDRGDLNGDGIIDIADYSLLASNFDGVDDSYPGT